MYQPRRVNKARCTDRLSSEGTEIQRLISNKVKTQTQTLRFPAEPQWLASQIIYLKAFYFVAIKYLPTAMSVGLVYTRCPQRPEEGVRAPGTWVMDSYEAPRKVLGVKPRPSSSAAVTLNS